MTDLRDQLARLLDHEPQAPYDIDDVVRSGRRARRRQHLAIATASTVGAAGVTAAVAIPLLASGGTERSVTLGVKPPASPAATHGKCYIMASPRKTFKQDLAKFIRSGRVGPDPSIIRVKTGKQKNRIMIEVCTHGTTAAELQKQQQAQQPDTQEPTGPPYDYTEQPDAIASRLGAHLHDRVTALGLSITFTRPFAQETSKLESGHPTYYAGNVDVHEANGYADIGVQVTHAVTEQVPFTGDCTDADHCVETKLPDGSVLRTGQVQAGKGDVILTAEVHRPDGVVVQAQESNYPFGPDAGSQPHGGQPLTLDQLVALATDAAFTF
jgi:hypothetical protein